MLKAFVQDFRSINSILNGTERSGKAQRIIEMPFTFNEILRPAWAGLRMTSYSNNCKSKIYFMSTTGKNF